MNKIKNLGSEHLQADDQSRNGINQPIPSMDEIFAKHTTYLLRWMFFFWITQMITILAGYFIK